MPRKTCPVLWRNAASAAGDGGGVRRVDAMKGANAVHRGTMGRAMTRPVRARSARFANVLGGHLLHRTNLLHLMQMLRRV